MQDLVQVICIHILYLHFLCSGNSAVVHGNEEALYQSDLTRQLLNLFLRGFCVELEDRRELLPFDVIQLPNLLQQFNDLQDVALILRFAVS